MGDVGTQKSLPQTQLQAETPRPGSLGYWLVGMNPPGAHSGDLDQLPQIISKLRSPEESITLQITLGLFWKDETVNISKRHFSVSAFLLPWH